MLITYETAKLAKEKGFDWGCSDCFDDNGHYYSNGWCERLDDFFKDEDFFNSSIEEKEMSEKYFTAPTQSELQKWLREKIGIDVYCMPVGDDSYEWYNNIASHNPPFQGTYEEALEVGLLEALRLIKKI